MDDPFPILWKGSIQSVSESVNRSSNFETSSCHNIPIDRTAGDVDSQAPLIQTLNSDPTCDNNDSLTSHCPTKCNGDQMLLPLVHNNTKPATHSGINAHTMRTSSVQNVRTASLHQHHAARLNQNGATGSVQNVNRFMTATNERSHSLTPGHTAIQQLRPEPTELYLNCKNINSQDSYYGSSPGATILQESNQFLVSHLIIIMILGLYYPIIKKN